MKQLCILFSFIFFLNLAAKSQVVDSLPKRTDSALLIRQADSTRFANLILQNNYLNTKAQPVAMLIRPRNVAQEDGYFYVLLGITLLFGIARAAYARYFSNLFRVFFNSSLRQSQLTDQLVQDQLPSLIFNLLFVFSGGLYVYFLLHYFQKVQQDTDWRLMGACVILFAAVYFAKYITLKFTGWVTGFKQEADIYTFIIFLINKIIGICLLPVIVVLAFSTREVSNVFVMISFVLIGLLMLMRFFRSYGLLQTRIRVSRFHFFLYIFSVEILPLFLIYRAAVLFFNKNW